MSARRARSRTGPPAPSATTTGTLSLENGGARHGRRIKAFAPRCRTITALRVLDYLAALERGGFARVTPSRAQIAANIGRCERSVTRAVAELETIGAVRVVRDRPHRRDDGTFTRARTNLYRLRWPKRGTNALVAPRGHARHVKASYKAVAPPPRAVQPPLPALIEPDPPPDEAPAPPPWLEEGITLDEYLARARARA